MAAYVSLASDVPSLRKAGLVDHFVPSVQFPLTAEFQ